MADELKVIEVAGTEPKPEPEPVVKEEPKEEEKPKPVDKKIPLTIDGVQYELSPDELLSLAMYGGKQLKDQREAGEKKKVEEDGEMSAEDRIAKLEAELKGFKQQTDSEKEYAVIQQTLTAATEKHERLKNKPKLAAIVNSLALANYNNNPKTPLTQWHSQVAKTVNEIIDERVNEEKEKIRLNGKVSAITNSSVRGGAAAAFDAKKVFKAGDVESGASLRAMREFLSQSSKGD